MRAEIITIGDEILIGQIVDSNSAFIGKSLSQIGITVKYITSIGDDQEAIISALRLAESRTDLIIITGGLGPTKDDITKKTLATYFNDSLVLDKTVLLHIEELWRSYIKQPLLQVNRDQALVLSKAEILANHYGSAPGMWIEKGQTVVVSLPGVPYEMKSILNSELLPKLTERFQLPTIVHRTILTQGMGESLLAERISDWENMLDPSIKLSYLPNLGRVRLRLSSIDQDKMKVEIRVQSAIDTLLPLIQDIFVGFEDNQSIETIIGDILTKRNQTLSLAESCTGGAIAGCLTSHPGASKYFKGSLVSYATAVKTEVLGVDDELIQDQGVVSEAVAIQMAQKVRALFKTDYAISTTGDAGPSTSEGRVTVGTVCIAIAGPTEIQSGTFQFGKSRERVIKKAVNKAFELLYKEILKNASKEV